MRHKAFDPYPGHPAIHALVSLHAQLGGKIKDNKAEAERLANDMKAVEAVIRMFNPDYDTRRIAVRRRQKSNPWFKRGTVYRFALDALREAGQPLTTADVVDRMLTAKGVAGEATKAQVKQLRGAVQQVLGDIRRPTLYHARSAGRNAGRTATLGLR
jgi:hypothetical protein